MEQARSLSIPADARSLSIAAFAGLTLLAAALWNVASGYVILLFIPALLICFVQIVVRRRRPGLTLGSDRWHVSTPDGDHEIPVEAMSHLRITRQGADARACLVLTDGGEVALPFDLPAEPDELLRAAAHCGVEVRRD